MLSDTMVVRSSLVCSSRFSRYNPWLARRTTVQPSATRRVMRSRPVIAMGLCYAGTAVTETGSANAAVPLFSNRINSGMG